MSLIDQIRMAQRDAGEAAVMADLKRKGLLIEEPEAPPPEADTLLQQALEYAKLMKLYGPAMGYGNTTIDDHIAALRTYLEGKK